MIKIDPSLCIGCGLCLQDCVAENIEIKEGKAKPLSECILCGHCVAVCPQNAITVDNYDMSDIVPCEGQSPVLSPEKLLLAIKSRRSIRQYTDRPVSPEEIQYIIQAGRYTATAKNGQDCRFVFIQKDLEDFKNLVWNSIEEVINDQPKNKALVPYRLFLRRHRRHPENDFLFRNCPAVLVIAADNPVDAALAAQNIELMANALGLGILYNGYLNHAAALENVSQWLECTDKKPQVTMLIGTPAIKYRRTAPRKPADYIQK